MPLRIAVRSDLPRISEILALGFLEENLYQKIFPHRKEYYEDYLRYWRRRCDERWWDYSRIFIVSYGGDQKTGDEMLTGVAEWQRVGLGWERLWGLWGWWDSRRTIHNLFKCFNSIHRFLFRNRAMARPSADYSNPLTKWNFEALMWPFIAHHFTEPPHRRNHWELATLGVDPKYQGQGIGRRLVSWGLQRAKEDELPAVVVGASGTERFYEQCGFEFLVGYATDGIDGKGNVNPLKTSDVGGGCIMWTRVKEDDDKPEQIGDPYRDGEHTQLLSV